MRTVEEAIITRLTGDATLVALLGGSGRIYHALEYTTPKSQSLVYMHITTARGNLNTSSAEIREEYYMFTIYHQQYEDVQLRMYDLLHLYKWPTPSDCGITSSIWDWEGPDSFEEDLKIPTKSLRYKFFVSRSARAPVS